MCTPGSLPQSWSRMSRWERSVSQPRLASRSPTLRPQWQIPERCVIPLWLTYWRESPPLSPSDVCCEKCCVQGGIVWKVAVRQSGCSLGRHGLLNGAQLQQRKLGFSWENSIGKFGFRRILFFWTSVLRLVTSASQSQIFMHYSFLAHKAWVKKTAFFNTKMNTKNWKIWYKMLFSPTSREHI